MDYRHISELDIEGNIGNRIFGVFLARDVEVRTQKDGVTKYISLNMCDKHVVIDTKKFGATEAEIEMMQNGKVYCAAIDVKPYAKSSTGYSCLLYNFDVWNEDPAYFVEWTPGINEAVAIIQNAIKEIYGTTYGMIADSLMRKTWNKFAVWTAANSMHHNALGGLLVHTAEVVKQSELIADYWIEKYGTEFIDKNLLLSAAILHDIGKLKELDVDVTTGITNYSTDAALETHIISGVEIIIEEARQLGIGYNAGTEKIKTQDEIIKELKELKLLKHCILAHHGKKEYGSPITPSIPEAYILNISDNISAEMFKYNRTYSEMSSDTSDVKWVNGEMVLTYKK